jgi:hypothetical protein
VLEQRRRLAFEVLAEQNVAGARQHRSEQLAAPVERLVPEILTVELDRSKANRVTSPS